MAVISFSEQRPLDRHLPSNVNQITVRSDEIMVVVFLKSLVSALPRSGALLAEQGQKRHLPAFRLVFFINPCNTTASFSLFLRVKNPGPSGV